MGILDGKVALVTGAGRGIGREHALMMASEGAKVVVNDLGGDAAGGGADATPAQDVVAEIEAMGGEAVVNGGNVAVFDEAGAMVQQAIDTFGDINIIVNNAGILRDRMLFSMSEDDWDAVIAVHLKGTFAPSNHAAKYWREKAKAGEDVYGRIINTASLEGLSHAVYSMAVQGQKVYSGLYNGNIQVWHMDAYVNLPSGSRPEYHTLTGHKSSIYSLVVTERQLLSASHDKLIKVWDLNTMRCRHTLRGHNSRVRALALKINFLWGSLGAVSSICHCGPRAALHRYPTVEKAAPRTPNGDHSSERTL